jgi:hypothetical protein
MAFVAGAKVIFGVLGPLIRFRKQQPPGKCRVHLGSEAFEDLVCFGKIFVARAFTLDEVWNRVESQPIDAQL